MTKGDRFKTIMKTCTIEEIKEDIEEHEEPEKTVVRKPVKQLSRNFSDPQPKASPGMQKQTSLENDDLIHIIDEKGD